MDHLTLSFFGAFQATLGDRPRTAFRSAKVQGILVYLVLTQQPQAREGLAALFWPDEPEAVAKQNLRQSIFRLLSESCVARVQDIRWFLIIARHIYSLTAKPDHHGASNIQVKRDGGTPCSTTPDRVRVKCNSDHLKRVQWHATVHPLIWTRLAPG